MTPTPKLGLTIGIDRERVDGTEMRKVIVNEFMSLDGVVQAPGGADEDPSGGFDAPAA